MLTLSIRDQGARFNLNSLVATGVASIGADDEAVEFLVEFLRAIIGELSPSAKADIVAIPYNGSLKEVYEATLYHKGKILGSMIDGKWAYRNNAF